MREIILTNGMVALCDDDNYEQLSLHTWTYKPNGNSPGYAITGCGLGTISMHRMIMDKPKGLQIDHRDGNTLDCQKNNLRIATHQQNMWNAVRPIGWSGYIGVEETSSGYYRARIRVDGNKKQHLGTYITAQEAAMAYNEAALQLRGEFAVLNEIGEISGN